MDDLYVDEDALRRAREDPASVNGGGDGDEEEEDSEEGIQMRVYTAKLLLNNTEKSLTARQQPKAEKKKRVSLRIWSPEGEYRLIRNGIMLPDDPDKCLDALQERTLAIFRNIDDTVEYAADPKRPMWKGVFVMRPEAGYAKDLEYYEPKQTHLQQIYALQWPKKNRPNDNLQERRDGLELPYWVDDWFLYKTNEERHKQKSKNKRASLDAAASTSGASAKKTSSSKKKKMQTAKDGDDTKRKKRKENMDSVNEEKIDASKCVIAPEPNFIFPLSGWMRDHVYKKKSSEDTASVAHNTMLKTSPATALVKKMPTFVSQLCKGRVAVVSRTADDQHLDKTYFGIEPQPGAMDDPTETRWHDFNQTGENMVHVRGGSLKNPTTKRPLSDEDDDDNNDDNEEPVFAVPAPVEKKQKTTPVPSLPPVPPTKHSSSSSSPLIGCPPNIQRALHDFAVAAAAGICQPGSFYESWFSSKPEGADPDLFYAPGAPGDCIPSIALMLSKRLVSK